MRICRNLASIVLVLVFVPTLVAQDESSRTIAGKVSSIAENGKSFELKDYDGKTWSFQIPQTLKVRSTTGKEQKITDVSQGSPIAVSYSKEGNQNNASFAGMTTTIQGKLSESNRTSIKMTDSGNKSHTFNLQPGARVVIDSRESKLADLPQNSQLTVYYVNNGSSNVACEIRSQK